MGLELRRPALHTDPIRRTRRPVIYHIIVAIYQDPSEAFGAYVGIWPLPRRLPGEFPAELFPDEMLFYGMSSHLDDLINFINDRLGNRFPDIDVSLSPEDIHAA